MLSAFETKGNVYSNIRHPKNFKSSGQQLKNSGSPQISISILPSKNFAQIYIITENIYRYK